MHKTVLWQSVLLWTCIWTIPVLRKSVCDKDTTRGIARLPGTQGEESKWLPITEIIRFKKSCLLHIGTAASLGGAAPPPPPMQFFYVMEHTTLNSVDLTFTVTYLEMLHVFYYSTILNWLTTGWMAWGLNSGVQIDPWAHPASCIMGTGSASWG